LLAKGELQAAEPMLTESLTLRQEQFGRNHPVTAESLLNLAALRIAQKRGDEVVSYRAKLLVRFASVSRSGTRAQPRLR
jgi:hypothetical protein